MKGMAKVAGKAAEKVEAQQLRQDAKSFEEWLNRTTANGKKVSSAAAFRWVKGSPAQQDSPVGVLDSQFAGNEAGDGGGDPGELEFDGDEIALTDGRCRTAAWQSSQARQADQGNMQGPAQ